LETSVYIHKDYCNKGLGSKLYKELNESGKKEGAHVLIGGVSVPNPESQKLHEKTGFERVGTFKEVGYKFGRYVDVEFWQLTVSE
jgi:phosphinothricin acetyltransferase